MGQAKQRGTFEQRRAEAIARESQKPRRFERRPRHSPLLLAAMLGTVAGMTIEFPYANTSRRRVR